MDKVAVIMMAILSIALIFVYWKLSNKPSEKFTVAVAEIFTACTVSLWAFLGGIRVIYIFYLVILLLITKFAIKSPLKANGQ